MARPAGTKNIMRTPEEKEKIVIEYLNSKVGYRSVAQGNDIDKTILFKWIKKYRENGIEGLKSKTGKRREQAKKAKEKKDTPNFMDMYFSL